MEETVCCRVRVRSEIIREEETESVELECAGEYLFSPEKTVIRYEENTENGPVPNTVTVTKEDTGEKVGVRRGGSLYLELVCGQKRSGEYILPFGAIDMEYTSLETDTALGEYGGRLTLIYLMDIGGVRSENRVALEIETRRVCG